MKTLVGYVRDYLRRDVNWIYFGLLVTLLSLVVGWFYSDKEHLQLIGGGADDSFRYVNNLALYGGTLIGALLLFIPFAKDKSWLLNGRFWITVLFAVGLYAFAIFCYWHKEWIKNWTDGPDEIFWLRCASGIGKILILGIPVTIWWFLFDRKDQSLYGLKQTNVRPYLWMLAALMPLIIAASFTDGFQKMYPMVTRTLTVAKIEGDKFWYVSIFEFFYGSNYVVTEFFFRGFLILALTRWIGPHIILPVAAFYVTIHIGKPLGETISSFFGGIILGVITYRTKSIWGGVLIHVGIAFAMEIAAYVVKY